MNVKIVKNGVVIRSYPYTHNTMQKVFDKAQDIAGGMWNGKDEFRVIISS